LNYILCTQVTKTNGRSANTMKKIGYFSLRKQIFVYELKHMLRQIEHLLLFVIAFLGTALPALLFISLLAFGIILDNDSSSTQLLFIVWALVMTQSMLLQLVKQAILGSRYHLYLTSLGQSSAKRIAADLILGFICNPIVFLYLFVLMSISPQHWIEIPHGFLLLFLLLVGSLVSIYRPKGLYTFLLLSICSIPFLSSHSFIFGLLIFCVLQVLSILVFMTRKPLIPSFSLSFPVQWMFWLSLSLGSGLASNKIGLKGQKSNSLLSACAVASLLIIMTHYCISNLPDYVSVVTFIGAQLIVLSTASLQISIHRIIDSYPLFFSAYLANTAISRAQYWVSIAASLIMLSIASAVFGSFMVLLHLLSALFCIYCAKRLSKFFIASWLVSTGLLWVLIFIVF
jgi:hypothetical protein